MWMKKLQSPLEKYNILLPINQSMILGFFFLTNILLTHVYIEQV